MADDNSYQANQDVVAGARAIRSTANLGAPTALPPGAVDPSIAANGSAIANVPPAVGAHAAAFPPASPAAPALDPSIAARVSAANPATYSPNSPSPAFPPAPPPPGAMDPTIAALGPGHDISRWGPYNAALRAAALLAVKLGAFYEHKEAPAVLEALLKVAGAA